MAAPTNYSGTVASWNGRKGFGFITCPALPGGDVMFSFSEMPDDCREVQGKFLTGRNVTFNAQQNPDGRYKATAVVVPYEEGKEIAGKITSYSEKNGYGFITSSCLTTDARFERSHLPSSLPMGANLQGALVLAEIMPMPDGKLRVQKLMFQKKEIAERLSGGMPAMGGMGGGQKRGAGAMSGGMVMMPQVDMNQVTQMAAMMGMPVQMVLAHIQAQQAQLSGMMMGQPVAKAPRVEVQQTPTGQYTQGMIKSYNGLKGFGFIGAVGLQQDAFFFKDALPQEYQSSEGRELTGKSVQFEIVNTSDGKMRAANVTVTS
eukprot:TRINITY_DN14612_c0_g1_i1.p1 TRINITY_DN14612_c0_g1~~TRINITY_DN14612_c0_g1_i1.p1  ORF type:complete len:317 (+),score=74.42 TRINITY_DN14612_c0_g1_i1:79-1029(+)